MNLEEWMFPQQEVPFAPPVMPFSSNRLPRADEKSMMKGKHGCGTSQQSGRRGRNRRGATFDIPVLLPEMATRRFRVSWHAFLVFPVG
jgi:hypothetical protein